MKFAFDMEIFVALKRGVYACFIFRFYETAFHICHLNRFFFVFAYFANSNLFSSIKMHLNGVVCMEFKFEYISQFALR